MIDHVEGAMKFRTIRPLRGPNIWSSEPVLEAWLELGHPEEAATGTSPAGGTRTWTCRPDEIGPMSRDREAILHELGTGAELADVLAVAALRFQAGAGSTAGSGWVRPVAPALVRVAISYREEELARACLEAARSFCAVVSERPFDLAGEAARLRELADRLGSGVIVPAVLDEARRRGIPAARPFPALSRTLVVLGQGARGRHFAAAKTDRTGAVALAISADKELTRALLRCAGVPVPDGRPVDDAEDAWAAAVELGPPVVVVKPRGSDWGNGVALDLVDRDAVIAAYHAARAFGNAVLVEKQVAGREHRLLVVGGRVVAAALREPPRVEGDGRSTVAELVARVNEDPRRGDGEATPLARIAIDDDVLTFLSRQGLGPASVPPAGVAVALRRDARRLGGGTVADVTDLLHPEVAARAADAARAVGLDIAGVDVVAGDIGLQLEDQGGAVVEVNAEPALSLHLRPTSGSPRPVVREIVKLMFPPGEDGRIPVAAVTGTNGKTTTTRLLAHLLGTTGQTIGMTCSDGIYLGRRRIERGDCSGPHSARTILMHPAVEAAVLETARGGILTGGLGFDRCDVAVVTNLGEGDHLGSHGVETLDDLAGVKAVVVKSVAPGGAAVLNAGDVRVAAMAAASPAPVIFFARDSVSPVIVEHCGRGGRSVYARAGTIVVAEGGREQPVIGLVSVPLTRGGRTPFQVENTLAATAAAWALGLSPAAIGAGLRSFTADPDVAPARFNVFDVSGATLVVDYAHNASALRSLIGALDQFPAEERLAVFSAAGSRRDEDIVQQGEALGEGFDRVLLYEDQCNYGRPDGAVIALLRRGLASGSRVRELVDARGEWNAIRTALGQLRPGLLAVVFPESIEDSLEFIQGALLAGPQSGAQTMTIDPAVCSRPHPPKTPWSGAASSMVELTNVRRGRIIAVPYRDGRPGTPYVVPSGCVVEPLAQGLPEDLPGSFALDDPGRPAALNTPEPEASLLYLTGVYRMPSGEVAVVYGATANRIN